MAAFASRLFHFAERNVFRQFAQSNALPKSLPLEAAPESGVINSWSSNQVRTFGTQKNRETYTRPNETKRIKKLGWKARLSTPAGRFLLMRKILKGKFVLCHA